MSTPAWRRISEGDQRRMVLAVDFDSTARPEAGFSRLAPLLPPGREIWLTTQPDAAEKELLHAESYLQWWQQLPEGALGTVDTVMGYCVGGVFASALADRIAEQQGTRPALLLFDPEPVDSLSLYRDFRKAADAMSLLSEEERAGYVAQALTVCQLAGEDFGGAAPQIVKLYESAAGLVFDQLGLDEETADDLMGMFRSYVSYLYAARELSPEQGWASAVALTSAQSSPGAPLALRAQSFPLGTEELLNSQDVADAVHRLLEERGA
ncbi:hypothetical protein P3T36_002611 [Kitasatospora sp. MAP12-15]|uniref:hypothetical protein n=1 Tax=unclassified Kitasatospora TaxID=2633591 RepID=UPI0024765F74|nr:hypothetical protein [Kitasatospora sp. MAP12-44]MDH6112894.1 hypothetical protein [Kitasatospora sp. MAP12-44]